jgi:hypothetical protein
MGEAKRRGKRMTSPEAAAAFRAMSEDELDDFLEQVMQQGVKDGILAETGEFDIGENGKLLKRYRSLTH